MNTIHKVEVKSIVLTRAEGPREECRTIVCLTFEGAARRLALWAKTAPSAGHGKACKLRRFHKEQAADDYSRYSFRSYGLPIPRAKAAKVRRYIARRKRTGDRVIAALKHHQEVLACK